MLFAIAGRVGWANAPLVAVLLSLLSVPLAALAQDDLESVLQGLGTADVVHEDVEELEWRAGEGTLSGRVLDGTSGAPVAGATVILLWRTSEDDAPARQELATTDFDGAYSFPAVPAGLYDLSFVKAGYRASAMTALMVEAGKVNEVDFPLPPLATQDSGAILDLEAFVVEASVVNDLIANLDLRLDSDEMLNIMSSEDFSKFASTDVADALKRVAGVNVVEGQFAIIRGLEDRYSSTLFNGAPVPSPDPDKQSVQLDLFPSEIVSNLVLAKTFSPDLPSNSAGGSINILTTEYPEEFELKIKAGSGFESNAVERFLAYRPGSPVGNETGGSDVIESEFGGSIGGRFELAERELRARAVVHHEVDYKTARGWRGRRGPAMSAFRPFPPPGFFTKSGDLSLGELSLTTGRWDQTVSERIEQLTAFGAIGADLDRGGRHVVDASAFYTRKDEEVVELLANGRIPGFDYTSLAQKQINGDPVIDVNDYAGLLFPTDTPWFVGKANARDVEDPSDINRGPVWYTSVNESRSFETNRELMVFQLNGSDDIDVGDGLDITWAANHARTRQSQRSIGIRYFFEPDTLLTGADFAAGIPAVLPIPVEDLGPGAYHAETGAVLLSSVDIAENQWFGRLDAEYETPVHDDVVMNFVSGFWIEDARRDIDATFIDPASFGVPGTFSGPTPQAVGAGILGAISDVDGSVPGQRASQNQSEREIYAWHLKAKATLFENFDVLGGVRLEHIRIASNNDPFQPGLDFTGTQSIFPSKWLMFDRQDNPADEFVIRNRKAPFNDEILGIDVPIDENGIVDLRSREAIEALVNGEISEFNVLPSAGLAWRPQEGLNVRFAFSQTIARPSFREMGFYVTSEPGTSDNFVGNPQLELSAVGSLDGRVEYTWGGLGDLLAASAFYKTIDDPIEVIIIRDPTNTEGGDSAQYRTWFNNPNQASLWGLEFEARKNLGIFGWDFGEYLSVGGNFTWIDAQVDRSEEELRRAEPFFGTAPGDTERFPSLSSSRRLFGQPEWIVNGDVSLDQPDWGTKITLAVFAISDILTAAGGGGVLINGSVPALTLDRYVDSFHQLDLVASQVLPIDFLPGQLTFKISIKNLTDSTRREIYDPAQTRTKIAEREFKLGRDYSFTFDYTY